MKRNLKFERVYPYPPERLWTALTDNRALSEWLMPNDFQPMVGHHFQFRTKSAPGFDGIVQCEVLEVVPPRRLVYSWQGGPMRQSTTVIWTLEPENNGTRLRLEHNGFEGAAGILLSFMMSSGWQRLLSRNLAALLEKL